MWRTTFPTNEQIANVFENLMLSSKTAWQLDSPKKKIKITNFFYKLLKTIQK